MEAQRRLGGRYTLLNELGSGGMAVVWRAQDEVLGRPVAVKVLAGRYASDPQSRARIRDEARAAAALSHPNIAQVYDFGESPENDELIPYVVMELINGPTLAQRVSLGPLPPASVFKICGEVGAALAAAHADGLVHRDIKPANVMVTPSGAKVVDFGLAAVAGRMRTDEELFGTPAYLAPERLTGVSDVLPASDVYALGVLLYRLLANSSPWSVDSTTQMLDAHIYIEPQPLPRLPEVPDAVVDLVHRCLDKEPSARPTAAEVSAVLAAAADPPAPVSEPPAPPAPPRRKRRRLALAGAGVALVLAAASLAWAVVPDRAERDSSFGAPPVSSPSAGPQAAPDAGLPEDVSGAGANGAQPAGGGRSPASPGSSPGQGEATTAPRPSAAGSPTPPPSSAPTSEPPVDTQTLTSSVGSVEARCVRAKAHLTSWTAKDPYVVERVNAGPVLAATAVFKNKLSRVRMTVTCVAGTPTVVVLPL